MLKISRYGYYKDYGTALSNVNKTLHITTYLNYSIKRQGHAVAQLVEALHYELKGSGFDSGWGYWNFSLT